MSTFLPIPGFTSYEINRAGVIRRRLRSGPMDQAPLHVTLKVRRSGRGDGVLLVPDDKSLLRSGRNVWRSIPLLRSITFGLPSPVKPARKKYPLAAPDLDGEIWLPILGAEGRHEVSSFGRVRHARTRKLLKGTVTARHRYSRNGLVARKGDLYVCLSQGQHTGAKTRSVARLVCSAFHGKPERGMEANHIDGDTTNNRADNLEWLSKGQNLDHAWKTRLRTMPTGSKHYRAKLTPEQVREIRALRGHLPTRDIAKRYGVGKATIIRAQFGRTYQDVL